MDDLDDSEWLNSILDMDDIEQLQSPVEVAKKTGSPVEKKEQQPNQGSRQVIAGPSFGAQLSQSTSVSTTKIKPAAGSGVNGNSISVMKKVTKSSSSSLIASKKGTTNAGSGLVSGSKVGVSSGFNLAQTATHSNPPNILQGTPQRKRMPSKKVSESSLLSLGALFTPEAPSENEKFRSFPKSSMPPTPALLKVKNEKDTSNTGATASMSMRNTEEDIYIEKFKYLKRVRKLTMPNIGDAIGVSKNALSKWNNGKYKSWSEINKVKEWIDSPINVEYLIEFRPGIGYDDSSKSVESGSASAANNQLNQPARTGSNASAVANHFKVPNGSDVSQSYSANKGIGGIGTDNRLAPNSPLVQNVSTLTPAASQFHNPRPSSAAKSEWQPRSSSMGQVAGGGPSNTAFSQQDSYSSRPERYYHEIANMLKTQTESYMHSQIDAHVNDHIEFQLSLQRQLASKSDTAIDRRACESEYSNQNKLLIHRLSVLCGTEVVRAVMAKLSGRPKNDQLVPQALNDTQVTTYNGSTHGVNLPNNQTPMQNRLESSGMSTLTQIWNHCCRCKVDTCNIPNCGKIKPSVLHQRALRSSNGTCPNLGQCEHCNLYMGLRKFTSSQPSQSMGVHIHSSSAHHYTHSQASHVQNQAHPYQNQRSFPARSPNHPLPSNPYVNNMSSGGYQRPAITNGVRGQSSNVTPPVPGNAPPFPSPQAQPRPGTAQSHMPQPPPNSGANHGPSIPGSSTSSHSQGAAQGGNDYANSGSNSSNVYSQMNTLNRNVNYSNMSVNYNTYNIHAHVPSGENNQTYNFSANAKKPSFAKSDDDGISGIPDLLDERKHNLNINVNVNISRDTNGAVEASAGPSVQESKRKMDTTGRNFGDAKKPKPNDFPTPYPQDMHVNTQHTPPHQNSNYDQHFSSHSQSRYQSQSEFGWQDNDFVDDLANLFDEPRPKTTASMPPPNPNAATNSNLNYNNSAVLCIMCCQNQKDTLFSPCSHVCACNSCARKVNVCPICREPIRQKSNIFLS